MRGLLAIFHFLEMVFAGDRGSRAEHAARGRASRATLRRCASPS